MRLYTVNVSGEEKILISVDGGNRGFFTEQLGFGFRDMNELICAAEQE